MTLPRVRHAGTVYVRNVKSSQLAESLWPSADPFPYNSFQPLRVPAEERGIPETAGVARVGD